VTSSPPDFELAAATTTSHAAALLELLGEIDETKNKNAWCLFDEDAKTNSSVLSY
jgi:hypothetical protein